MSFALIFGGFGSGGAGGGGGGFTLVGSLDYGTTPSASDDFDITGADEVEIVHHGLAHPGDFGVRLSDDAGATFYASSGDYLRTSFDDAGSETDVAAALMRIGEGNRTAAAGRTWLSGLQGAHPTHGLTEGNRVRAGAEGIAHNKTKDALGGPFDRLRIVCPSGNITAGKLYVYKR